MAYPQQLTSPGLVGQLVHTDPVLRMYAAYLPEPISGRSPAPVSPAPAHRSTPTGALAVRVSALRDDPELAGHVFGQPTGLGTVGLSTLLTYFAYPLVRVVRAGLDHGRPLVDPRGGDVLFELTTGRLPTGRLLLPEAGKAEPPEGIRPDTAPGALELLVEAFTAVTPGSRPAAVHAKVASVLAAELRYLRPRTARVLAGWPGWSGHVHSVPAEQDRVLWELVNRVRAQASAGRATPELPTPVVRVHTGPTVDPDQLARFGRELFQLGGELRLDHAATDLPDGALVGEVSLGVLTRPSPGTGRPPPVVRTLERVPALWRRPGTPRLSQELSLSRLDLRALREHPLGEQYAVHWDHAEVAALCSRLVAAARSSAARTAEAALAACHGQPTAGEHDTRLRLIHHVLQRDQFRAGRRSHYQLRHAHADLADSVARGAPLRLWMLQFPAKHGHSGLKAAGFLPDLAELATLARILELAETLRRVYPPGVEQFDLFSDGTHFRPHPPDRIEAGVRVLRAYARAVTGALVRIHDLDTHLAETLGQRDWSAHQSLRADAHAEYRRRLGGLDLAADPLTALNHAATLDSGATLVQLFRSLIHSVPLPPHGDHHGWGRAVHQDVYQVGPEAEPELRRARQQVLRDCWRDTLDYAAVLRADDACDLHRRILPGGLRLTVRPRDGRAGFGPLGHRPAPWHATAAIDSASVLSCDFLVALRDQGFVPLYAPPLGERQPFAMVPVTAVRTGADGVNRLAPEYTQAIRVRTG